jgi:Tfp pilus assembly protein PilO
MMATIGTRTLMLLGGVLIAAILAMGWFLGVDPQLKAAASADAQRTEVEQRNQLEQLTLQQLEEQFANLPALTAELATLRQSVPSSARIEALSRQIFDLLLQTGTSLSTFTAGDAVPLAESADDTTVIPAGVSADRFATIDVSMSISGTRESVIAFIEGLQTGERLVLLTDVSVSSGEDGIVTSEVSGIVYMMLDSLPASAEEPAEPVEAADQ